MLKAINNFKERDDNNEHHDFDSLQYELEEKNALIERLKALIEVNSIITSSLDKTRVLKNILDQTKIVMKCIRSSILLVDFATNELRFHVITNEEEKESLKDVRLKMGEGIAGAVWQRGKPIMITDCQNDSRFSDVADKISDFITNSIIAVPLVVNGTIIGVMEAINKSDNEPFDSFDMEILSNLSIQAAIAIENANLYELAINDGMTGLYIHRYFQQRLTEEFNRAERYGNELSLIIFDIDHFKEVNDTFGHQAGDEVLIKLSHFIKKSFRSTDIICRYGGEEIAVILPNSRVDETYSCAQRVRRTIEKMNITYNKSDINVTISGGVVSMNNHNPCSKDAFIKMADEALYMSKNSGRNQITIYKPE